MASSIDWPTDLPQAVEAGSYQYMHGSGVVRTGMDSGPPKVRRRFTALYHRHSCSMVMTKTQFTTYFQPFFDNTIFDGTVTFNFPNFLDDGATTIETRFLQQEGQDPYTWVQDTPTNVRVAFTLEEMP